MEHNKQLYEHLFQAIRKQLESGPARTEENGVFRACSDYFFHTISPCLFFKCSVSSRIASTQSQCFFAS